MADKTIIERLQPSLLDRLTDMAPESLTETRDDRVIYAFGHGHLGLTLSAVTAELVKTLVSGDTPPFDLTPYRINRF